VDALPNNDGSPAAAAAAIAAMVAAATSLDGLASNPCAPWPSPPKPKPPPAAAGALGLPLFASAGPGVLSIAGATNGGKGGGTAFKAALKPPLPRVFFFFLLDGFAPFCSE
jgi:hypothetical protein